MKYIISEDMNSFPPFIIRIFPASEQHSEVAEKMKGKVIGAGFCCIKGHTSCECFDIEDGLFWECYGESTSLNITSRGDADSEILNALTPPVDKTFDLNSRIKSQR